MRALVGCGLAALLTLSGCVVDPYCVICGDAGVDAGRDAGLVARVAAYLKPYKGQAAIMSFDHWLIRQFGEQAPGIPGGPS